MRMETATVGAPSYIRSMSSHGISTPAAEAERGIWFDARPPDHSLICWAGALGRAHHLHPLLDAREMPAQAMRVLAREPAQCKCQAHNKGRPGRRT